MTACGHDGSFRIKDYYSALTHFIGFIFSIFMMAVLLFKGNLDHEPVRKLAVVTVFSCSAMLLYGASTAYHTVDVRKPYDRILKKTDHLSIFILIAGTYTPYALLALKQDAGHLLLLEVWGMAIAGMLFKLFWINCPKWVSSVLYIAMGWVCLTVFPQLLQCLSTGAFLLTLAGGLFYTAGGVIYSVPCRALEGKPFGMHEIFHCFVLAGTFCHFLVMFLYFV